MRGPLYAVLALWMLWLASWLLARAWSKRTVGQPALGSQLAYSAIVDIGAVLLVTPVLRALGPPLWAAPPMLGWALVGVAIAGFGICWWARITLAGNWSWHVTLKEAHTIVEAGPYRFVRHPIYTGVLLAGFATAALEGKAVSLLGLAMMVAGFWIKARLEERFLRSELGAASYDGYAARTGMLLPKRLPRV
ncbi:MAG TPA: isoprenylcysteine carboxylmethyltransferase family protein [Caulobacteraceae bacterium]|jgi:protein-S-isoprenylcysteine O-methyltransferase Ste14